MVYKAPYGAPPGGSEPARPPVVRERVSASKQYFERTAKGAVMDQTHRIIARRWAEISHLLLGMRQRGTLLPAAHKMFSYPDIDIEYQRLGKQETINLTVYPEKETRRQAQSQTLFDLNFDGYVAWVHWQQPTIINGNKFVIGPFDIFLNDYLIATDFQPEYPCGGYVILFGATALKCESYQDDAGRTNNQLVNSNPGDVIQVVQPRPGWGKRPEMPSPVGGTIPEFTVELGYWLWDIQEVISPTNYIYNGSDSMGNPTYVTWKTATRGDAPNPVFSKAKWFQFADNSPLQHEGGNTMRWNLSAKGQSGEVLLAGFGVAEFYSRTQFRNVQTSWNYTAGRDDTLSLNDSPLVWTSSYAVGGFWSGGQVDFDLTPDHDDTDWYGSSPPLGGPYLTDIEQLLLSLWSQQVTKIATAYNNAVNLALADWNARWQTPAALKLLNEANNIYGFWTASTDAQGHKLPSVVNDYAHARGADGNEVYGPVQEYLYDWDKPFDPSFPLPADEARWFASLNHVTMQVDFLDTSGNSGIDFSVSPQMAFVTVTQMFAFADNYVKDPGNPINQKQTDYQNTLNSVPPPDYPPRPKVGQDYTAFSYRDVEIVDTKWSYPISFSRQGQ